MIGLICAFFNECTFCSPSTEEMNSICPNYGGEFIRRPKKPQNVCSL
ncbi:DUF1272 domain-containing protein [Neobacillus ginsengisoli]